MHDPITTVRQARDLIVADPVVTIGPRRRCTVCAALISRRPHSVRAHRRWHQALAIALGASS